MSRHFQTVKYVKDDNVPDLNHYILSGLEGILKPEGFVFLALPDHEPEERTRVILECLCNEIEKQADNASVTRKRYSDPVTESGIHEDMVIFFREIGDLLQYIVNSTSWEKNELKEYDKIELRQRLDFIRSMIK